MPDLRDGIFTDIDHARAALEAIRWPNGPICPHCRSGEKIGLIQGKRHRPGLRYCGDCERQFTVTVGTVFESSKVPLNKWWLAAHLLGSSEQGINISELRRKLGVTYKTAWLMAQRLRIALKLPHAFSNASPVKGGQSDEASRPNGAVSRMRLAAKMAALLEHERRGKDSPRDLIRKVGVNSRQRRPDPEATRNAILEVACSQLSKVGHEALSLTEVARAAGVNRGTAYHHFKTRQKLVKATTDWVSEMLHRAAFGDSPRIKDSPIEKLDVADLNDRLALFAMENPELCRVWLLQMLASPEPASDLFWREYHALITRWGKTKMAQPNVDLEVDTVSTLAGLFLWPVWAQSHAKNKSDERQLARRYTNERLRSSIFGNLRAEYYPDIIKRLKETAK